MAIKFKNIRNNEIRVADSEPLIAALYNSSDKGPNANNAQDFGWRLAPEVVVQMRRIMRDEMQLERIAARYKKPFGEVTETDVLMFISEQTASKDAPVAQDGDYEDDYHAEIARLEKDKSSKKSAPAEEDEDDSEGEELSLMTRKDLNEMARGLGIPDAEKLPNIAAVIEKIEEARG